VVCSCASSVNLVKVPVQLPQNVLKGIDDLNGIEVVRTQKSQLGEKANFLSTSVFW
jgi:hypothetical protein